MHLSTLGQILKTSQAPIGGFLDVYFENVDG